MLGITRCSMPMTLGFRSRGDGTVMMIVRSTVSHVLMKFSYLEFSFCIVSGAFLLSPNTGTKAQTIERLFGGNAAAYDEWDPATVMAGHGPYEGVAGWFAVSTPAGTRTAPVAGSRCRRSGPRTSGTSPAPRRPRRSPCADSPANTTSTAPWCRRSASTTGRSPQGAHRLAALAGFPTGYPGRPGRRTAGTRPDGVTIAASGGR